MKIVINTCWGGFGLSVAGEEEYLRRSGRIEKCTCDVTLPDTILLGSHDFGCAVYETGEKMVAESWTGVEWQADDTAYEDMYSQAFRADSILVAMVEEDSSLYGSSHAQLKVVEIPDGVEWQIKDYDGMEHIAEKHRIWC